MKQFICYILLLTLTGHTTVAQVNPLFKKTKPAFAFAADKQGLVKKDASLYPPPRFSFYAYPLAAIEPVNFHRRGERRTFHVPNAISQVTGYVFNCLFSTQLYNRYPTNPDYWTSRSWQEDSYPYNIIYLIAPLPGRGNKMRSEKQKSYVQQ